MSDMFNDFDKIGTGFERGQYFPAGGEFEVEVVKCQMKRTRKAGDAFIVEAKILSVKGLKDGDTMVGTVRNWFQSLTDKDIGLPEVKGFMMAALGLNPHSKEDRESIDPEIKQIANDAIDKNGLAGSKLNLSTFSKVTKARGVDFTVHQWSPAAKKA